MHRLLFGVLLILSMVLSAITITTGTANADGPFYIYTQEGLQSIGQADDPTHIWSSGNASFDTWGLDDDYVLMADLVLTGNFKSIGNTLDESYSKFIGSFEGNGHTITNLNISQASYDYAGLFTCIGSISSANLPIISNVSFINPIVIGHSGVGSLVGRISPTSVAGVVTIINCSTINPVIHGIDDVGGLIGKSYANIYYCHAINVSISSTGISTGGISGFSCKNIYRSYVKDGSVTGSQYSGGLVGASYTAATINDSYAENVNVTSTSTSGGFVGYNPTGAIIINSYSTGIVTGGANGFTDGGTVTDCYWDVNTSGMITGARGTGKTTVEMMNISTFSTWDIEESTLYTDETWWITSGSTYPRLSYEEIPEIEHAYLTMAMGAGGASITPTAGEHEYVKDVTVNISATADTHYHFINWTGTNVSQVDNVNIANTTINMSANASITANFAEDTYYTFTYTAGINGSINGTSPQKVYAGYDGSAVIPVPDACYQFVNWSDSSTANPRTDLNAASDITVTANFEYIPYTFTYDTDGNGTITGDEVQYVNCGDDGAEVVAIPNPCYIFVKWSDDVMTANRTDLNAGANIDVTASFEIISYTLTYIAGNGGNISGTTPQTVNCSADGSLVTAIPNSGYSFVNWSDSIATAGRTDLNVSEDLTVIANFEINTIIITIGEATDITIDSATLGATIDLNDVSGAYFWFVYGDSSWATSDWYYAPYGYTNVDAIVSQELIGLLSGVEYGYYVVGIDEDGTSWVYSTVATFTTEQSTIGWFQKVANMLGLHDSNGRLLFAMICIFVLPGLLYVVTRRTFISLLAAILLVGLFAVLGFLSLWVVLPVVGFLIFALIKVIGMSGSGGGVE